MSSPVCQNVGGSDEVREDGVANTSNRREAVQSPNAGTSHRLNNEHGDGEGKGSKFAELEDDDEEEEEEDYDDEGDDDDDEDNDEDEDEDEDEEDEDEDERGEEEEQEERADRDKGIDKKTAKALHREKKTSKDKGKKKKKKRSLFIDDAAEEDDEGDRRLKRSRFIDDIAEVDDEEDEEEEEEEGMDDLIDDRGEAPDEGDLAEVRRAVREAEIRAARDEEINPEELQKYLEERFGRDRVAAYAKADEEAITGVVTQQALMPTVRDPKLWVVRCSDGSEREAVVCLLQKCYDYAAKGQPLLIKSAFAKDKLKGYVYIEAYKDAHVREALKGLRPFYASKPPKLVPLTEMVAAITVPKSTARSLTAGSWVRPKTGLYKGDLAKVMSVDINSGRATITLVPRLDYAAIVARLAEGRRGFEKVPKVRPVPRAFNADEARNSGLDVMQQRDRVTGEMLYVLNGTQRFSHGYLSKNVAIRSLVLQEALPPLDELQAFNAARQGDANRAKEDGDGVTAAGGELASLVKDLGMDDAAVLEAASVVKFSKGDRVIVVEGDLKDIQGVVEVVTEDGQVMVRPTDESLEGFKEAIGFAPRELSKFFQQGDHVKVINGTHKGETGMVVNVKGRVCQILTDATRQEIRVFPRDLIDAVAVTSTLESLGDYELFDLVLLDQHTVGVIIDVSQDSCRVLTNQGSADRPEIKVCRLPDIKRKLNNRRNTAQDAHRNEISVNDVVDVKEGPLKGRSGTVQHIMRNFLFIRSREFQDNSGFMCVLSRHCDVRGGKQKQGLGSSATLATPSRILATPNPYSANAVLASPAHYSMGAGGRGAGGAMGSRQHPSGAGYTGRLATQQTRILEGRKVDIKRGPYRGMRGTIKSATPTHLRVELEAQYKTVTVDRQHVATEDGGIVAERPAMGMGMGMQSMYSAPGGRTPAHYFGAGPTPAHYTATPMHPSMTPGRDSVTKTPAYDPAWAATPAHTGFGSSAFDAPDTAYPGFGASMVNPLQTGATNGTKTAGNPGPAAGMQPQDWVGIEVILPSGEKAAVRTVGSTGEASVQLQNPADGKFSTGVFQEISTSLLQLALPARGQRVRLLGGEHKGQETIIEVAEGAEAFVKLGPTGIQRVQLGGCGKLVVD